LNWLEKKWEIKPAMKFIGLYSKGRPYMWLMTLTQTPNVMWITAIVTDIFILNELRKTILFLALCKQRQLNRQMAPPTH